MFTHARASRALLDSGPKRWVSGISHADKGTPEPPLPVVCCSCFTCKFSRDPSFVDSVPSLAGYILIASFGLHRVGQQILLQGHLGFTCLAAPTGLGATLVAAAGVDFVEPASSSVSVSTRGRGSGMAGGCIEEIPGVVILVALLLLGSTKIHGH